ncbi:dehydrogenase with different specificitie [Phaeosphaeria sp. MPI-PUGE-AT-0046c]|nr:dehydrogenase with different specificitie [Phaeosphaeria sp. MPI-PUGE-AT-0046c]
MAPQITYNPQTDIPDLTGKVFFVTGGTAGLGKQTITYLARHNPAAIHFTGRNVKAGEDVKAEISKILPNAIVKFYECDQTSLASVHAAANLFLAGDARRLDVLICNAGIMGGPIGLTKDGYEIQFGINYLSHALFTKLFTPLLETTASTHGEARIVNLTSAGYTMHSGGLPFADLKTTQDNIGLAGKWARYGQSKFAQVLYTSECAKRHPKITALAIHPGVVHTNLVQGQPLWDRLFVKLTTLGQAIPSEQGSYNTCWAATSENAPKSGSVYYPVGVFEKHTKAASDEGLWRELWEWTENELEAYV